MPVLFVTLPAYNEEASLAPLLDEFVALRLPEGWTMRVIVVDDGSRDRTAEIAASYGGRLVMEVIRHPKNRGLGGALKTGLHAAMERAPDLATDVAVCMDADNTHHPRHILEMIEKLDGGLDLVIASRYQPGSQQVGVPPIRLFYSLGARLLFMVLLRLRGVRDYTCGYRAYRLDLVKRGFDAWGEQLIERSGFACTDELLVKLARLKPAPKLGEVPFILRYDLKRGGSKLPLLKTIMGTLHLCLTSGRPPKKQ